LKNATTAKAIELKSWIPEILALAKYRLTFTVVLSAALGFGMAPGPFDIQAFLILVTGGFLVTGASNGFNQVIEKDTDRLMKRTKDRPLPTGRLSTQQGLLISSLMAIAGLVLLGTLNLFSLVLGFLALFVYVVIYTPLKRITPWAVFVGAFPGAIPPMLGYVAATGEFGYIPGILFAVQFVWQFPHFWSIAWVGYDEYQKAGFSLLPSKEGKNTFSAFQIFLYSLLMIPVSLLPWGFAFAGYWSAIAVAILGVGFAFLGLRHLKKQNDQTAKSIMFASFIYLPLVQFLFLIDKL
jgi:protoheme IX farnesyltransferase